MFIYVLRRLLLALPVLALVSTLVFFLMRLAPGDPVDFILGENAAPADRQALIASHHFDKPVLEQLEFYWKGLVKGDLGKSYFRDVSVSKLIAERAPATLTLAVAAMAWAFFLAIPLGVLCSIRLHTWIDKTGLVFSIFGVSVPSFYLGPLLVLLFSIYLDWFPVSGKELPGSLWLPSLTLGCALSAILMRMTRASMRDTLSQDYIRTAKAKGLTPKRVILRHALRNSLLPVVAILGLQFGTVLTGAIVTEKIFSWPGLGSLLLEGISKRDYAVVQGCVLWIAVVYVIINLLTDIVAAWLDPRISLEGK